MAFLFIINSLIFIYLPVNTVAWAPSEYGNAQLAAGSSDGSISIHTFTGTVSAESAQVKRIQNAHPVR